MGVLSGQGIIVILVVGIVAGWLAGQIMRGGGFGLIGDLIVGILGALIGSWLFGYLGVAPIGNALVNSIIVSVVGAVILLFILRLIRR